MQLHIIEYTTGRGFGSFCPAIKYPTGEWVYYPETNPALIAVIGGEPKATVDNPQNNIMGCHFDPRHGGFKDSEKKFIDFHGRTPAIQSYFELNLDALKIDEVKSKLLKTHEAFSERSKDIDDGIYSAGITLNIGKHSNKLSDSVLIKMDGVTVIYIRAKLDDGKYKAWLIFPKSSTITTNIKIPCEIADDSWNPKKVKNMNVIIHDTYDYTSLQTIRQDIGGDTENLVEINKRNALMEVERMKYLALNPSNVLQISGSSKGSE